ncbi:MULTISPECIES: DUF3106 domain-containing protein [unclassified Acidovorax]|jgi:hypothetical protein|uniref:DUF3106 domain-containing protein n=1 Tax=unclassified Acidovorax TaxID=2684926 RepID=UPI0008C2E9D2|nr:MULTISPECIES: DUF3106 domain-containing protein [unclassified Acidovorax]OGA82174.1 MAG: hypothetical protein A2Z90_20685 [Burkholderiales bacterium GWA2_64_37]OGB11226.1 MAG: hypothetical protein A3C40_05090 [Burkholderiales bacterium RIFCSPHIGHO2_02_FULL_64_19]OGB14266.1 MAG: hypothetical protein A3E23_15470 [Burkholderiales bacterium RIFCSPHIGHO2_12_FULL_65_48]OGB52876.1 MAG: hypothetical protein A3F71_12645 [Burkholderiales bacterium RIFCSPLOWO2_12_FULL_64_33]HCE91687.1 hypothetical pro
MHPSSPDASPALPAFVLALALLGVLAAVGGQVLVQMRMAPGTLLPAGAEAAVASPNNARTSTRPGTMAVPQVETGPGWETLTTPQKLALYPLAERWALISEAQKRRWLALAANFSALPEEEQAKFHDRMTDWASLSAQQRNQARLNYAVTNRLARDDKRAQWEAYQALSDEEKRALAARAAPKPKGAATALRPVSPKKLAQVPAATQANPSRPNAPKIPPVLDHSAPRVAAPVTPTAPPATGVPTQNPASNVVETAPVSIPVAVPAALPPLGAGSAETPATTAPMVTPDNSGLYPQ